MSDIDNKVNGDEQATRKRKQPEPADVKRQLDTYNIHHLVGNLNAAVDSGQVSICNMIAALNEQSKDYPNLNKFLNIAKMDFFMGKIRFYSDDPSCIYLMRGDLIELGLLRNQIPLQWYTRYTSHPIFAERLIAQIDDESIYRAGSIILSHSYGVTEGGVFIHKYYFRIDPRLPKAIEQFRIFMIEL